MIQQRRNLSCEDDEVEDDQIEDVEVEDSEDVEAENAEAEDGNNNSDPEANETSNDRSIHAPTPEASAHQHPLQQKAQLENILISQGTNSYVMNSSVNQTLIDQPFAQSVLNDDRDLNLNSVSPVNETVLDLETTFGTNQTESINQQQQQLVNNVELSEPLQTNVETQKEIKNENKHSIIHDQSLECIMDHSINDSNIDYSSASEKTLLESPAQTKRVRKQTQHYGNPVNSDTRNRRDKSI